MPAQDGVGSPNQLTNSSHVEQPPNGDAAWMHVRFHLPRFMCVVIYGQLLLGVVGARADAVRVVVLPTAHVVANDNRIDIGVWCRCWCTGED